jgi:hypothetical protein
MQVCVLLCIDGQTLVGLSRAKYTEQAFPRRKQCEIISE